MVDNLNNNTAQHLEISDTFKLSISNRDCTNILANNILTMPII